MSRDLGDSCTRELETNGVLSSNEHPDNYVDNVDRCVILQTDQVCSQEL